MLLKSKIKLFKYTYFLRPWLILNIVIFQKHISYYESWDIVLYIYDEQMSSINVQQQGNFASNNMCSQTSIYNIKESVSTSYIARIIVNTLLSL